MSMSIDPFIEEVNSYKNEGPINEKVHQRFTIKMGDIAWLNEHRGFIETNKYGFGDKAFHWMWYLIISHLAQRNPQIQALEIGVFKGQVVSLWQLIANKIGSNIDIVGISPFEGNFTAPANFLGKIKLRIQARINRGNLYQNEDYLQLVTLLFERFNLSMENVRLIKGYSNDVSIYSQLDSASLDLLYIDGDHSYQGSLSDIKNYGPKLKPGGLLVMDDASFYLPGNGFYKGYKSVADACAILPQLGFSNILNVGHNRVFRKIR